MNIYQVFRKTKKHSILLLQKYHFHKIVPTQSKRYNSETNQVSEHEL